MGIVEQTLRKCIPVGTSLDITLIGGRELRGKVTAFAEDGIYLLENGYERPVAFAGIATYVPTEKVQADHNEKVEVIKTEPVQAPEKEEVFEAQEGWVERYETAAGVGSIACAERHAVFGIADVLDQQLADQLAGWFGRPIAVQCTLIKKGALVTAKSITGRRTQERFVKNDKQEKAETASAERHGFGEILHFDKKEGFGKACEGDVKFIFKRADIASDALWQEIIGSANTCGIKIAFTAVQEEGRVRYTKLREIAALRNPEQVEKPDFNAVIPMEEAEDVNPYARTTFTDGTVMEEETHAGFLMFYNADKNFGRLQKQDDGVAYYFRANDVMQKTLLDHLNKSAVVADTQVRFSVKKLPTGKEAAGRVTWEAPRPGARKPVAPVQAAVKPAQKQEQPASAGHAEFAPVKRAEAQPLNLYCENMLKLWDVKEEELSAALCDAAEKSGEAAEDLLLENVALSDVRREKRDDAMLRYLRLTAKEGGGDQLSSFLSTATYNGQEMFDALTRLFAVSDGAYGRLCGIIAAGGDLVMLRGEILSRFGQVPETASALKEMWRPLVEQERAQTAYASLLPGAEALKAVDPDGQKTDWAEVLALYEQVTGGQSVSVANAMQMIRSVREGIAQQPTRAAVEWMLPVLDKIRAALEDKSDAQGLAMRPLCSVVCKEEIYACVEVTGCAKQAVIAIGEAKVELNDINGSVQAVIPCKESKAVVTLKWNGGEAEQEMEFSAAQEILFDACKAQKIFEKHGVCVLRGGGMREVESLAALLSGDENCTMIRVESSTDEAELLRAMIKGVEAGLKEKLGDEAGIIGFPQKTEGLGAAELREELLSIVHSFGDVRLLHDTFKGVYIVILVDAGQLSETIAALANEMVENGVCTVLAASAEAQTEAEMTVTVCPDTAADRLRAAGFTADDVRL